MEVYMAKVWLTYAWNDNKDNDVDFVAQELENAGVQVRLDRWDINVGRRLWDQIENFIQNPTKSDAWLMYATQNSLNSQACMEEYFYALDRAIHARGNEFPIIAIFPSTVDQNLIPAGIRIRLYVSISDPDWKERIVAAAEGRNTNNSKPSVSPYYIGFTQDAFSRRAT
jgi:hypothetical protein